jgi:hypothetical protein
MTDYKFTIAVAEDNDQTQYYRYSNALDAVNVYNSFKDYGLAKYARTVVLTEPNGQTHMKLLRPSRADLTVIKRESVTITVK